MIVAVILSVGLVSSCSSESTKKAPAKKEVAKKSANKKAGAKKSNKKTTKSKKDVYTWFKFWNSAERKFAMNAKQVATLKAAKKTFDTKGKGASKDAVEKLRGNFYSTIKRSLGDKKGQEFINYMRRYKKRMRAERK